MERIFLLVLSLASALQINLQAQTIDSGSRWFDGRNMYEVRVISGEIQLFAEQNTGTPEIELVPMAEQDGWFSLKGEDNNGPLLQQSSMASLVEDNGKTMLVIYRGGKVDKLFEQTGLSSEEIIAERWYPTVRGRYSCMAPDGRTLEITVGDDTLSVNGQSVRYRMVTGNGAPLDVLDIQDGPAKGVWHFVRTIDGFNAYRSVLNGSGADNGFYDEVDDHPYILTWADPDRSRWSYLSDVFIIPIHYNKSTLRIIRNHILAMHGYIFQSKELQKYFEAQPWYKKARNNDSVQLNFIEQMNISRIQGEESKPDESRIRVTEEAPGIKRKNGAT